MTRTRLVLAILLSAGLIGGSLLHRTLGVQSPGANLYVAPQNTGSTAQYEKVEIPFVKAPTAENLSETDLIGRQLFSDYIGLATRGQATEANITALADQHVNVIGSLDKSTKKTLADLQVVIDSAENLRKYNDAATQIYLDYRLKLEKVDGGGSIYVLGSGLKSFSLQASAIYLGAATELLSTPVPSALASLHLNLVNNYLSSSAAMKAIAENETDPAGSFAGLVIQNTNMEEERVIILDMNKILAQYGI